MAMLGAELKAQALIAILETAKALNEFQERTIRDLKLESIDFMNVILEATSDDEVKAPVDSITGLKH